MSIDLNTLRSKITETDAQLLALLAQRLELTHQVAKTKIATRTNVRDPKREEELLVSLVKRGNKLGLTPDYVTNVFHVIIEHSVRNQQALLAEHANPDSAKPQHNVTFLGDKGSYSYLAAQRYFSHRPGTLHERGFPTFDKVIESVENGSADYGVLPIENTSSGSINDVYDQLQQTKLYITGELSLPVQHTMLTSTEQDPSAITKIHGHPQALTQCREFISELHQVEVVPCSSTSAAMEIVSKSEQPSWAAIGSVEGGKLYGLSPIAHNIALQEENFTRFIIVAKQQAKVPIQVPAKTTLVMSTIQKPGALVDALIVLKSNEINMIKLESRPIRGNPWEEMFYIDVEGNVDDGPMQKALEELRAITRHFKVLGCYAIAKVENTKVPVVKALADEQGDE